MKVGWMRAWSASQARVATLEWLDRLSVITTMVPAGLAASTAASKPWSPTELREGAVRVTTCPSATRSAPYPRSCPGRGRSPARLDPVAVGGQPGAGGKLRGSTGPSSSAQLTVVAGGGLVSQAMTLALLGRTPGRGWSSTSGSVASLPLRQQDPPDLAAADGDPLGAGGLGQGVQRPTRRRLGLVGCRQALAALGPPAGRRRAGQGDDPAALVLADAPGRGRSARASTPPALKRCSHL
jgi:hypothetical protein